MAEKPRDRAVDLDRSQLCCSVCLELLDEPVTVPCGHSYCRSCIDGCWKREEAEKGRCSCPQCRETFQPRPALRRNNMLAEVVERLKETGSEQTSLHADLPCAGPEDVACDFCFGTRRYKASMTCLTCLASYCVVHLEPHHKVPVLKAHHLVSATVPLQQRMCTEHNKLMEVYCQREKVCICYLCSMDHHQGHRTVSAAAERAEEQKLLVVNRASVLNRLQKREHQLKELIRAQNDFKSCNQAAVKSIDKIIDDLISLLHKRRSLAKEMINTQEKAAISEAKELQFQLEQEIDALKKRGGDLKQLSQTKDHIHFIQTFRSLSASCESPDLPLDAVSRPRWSMKTVTDSVSELKVNLEGLLKNTWSKMSATVRDVVVVAPLSPKTRGQFMHYCSALTLVPKTDHRSTSISEESRRVTLCYSGYSASCANMRQVLCREALSGRHYWEVLWKGDFCVVAVAYSDYNSSGDSEFGKNKSWSLECSSGRYTFRHNYKTSALSGPSSSCVGVYLDYKAGSLSFYNVSDEMTLIHKEQTTFTQPLHPGIGLKAVSPYGSQYAELVKLW